MRYLTERGKRRTSIVVLVAALLLWSRWLGWKEMFPDPSFRWSAMSSSRLWHDFVLVDFLISQRPDRSPRESPNESRHRPIESPKTPALPLSDPSKNSRTSAIEATDTWSGPLLASIDRERVLQSLFEDGNAAKPEGDEAAELVDSTLQSCARNRSIDLVFDTSFRIGEGPPFVFAGHRVVDLTDEVIASLRRETTRSRRAKE